MSRFSFAGSPFQYDGVNRLTAIIKNDTTVTADNQLVNQSWDNFGRPEHTRFGNGGVQTSLTYDGVSRVNTFGHRFTDTSHNLTLTYGYNVANQITLREFGNK